MSNTNKFIDYLFTRYNDNLNKLININAEEIPYLIIDYNKIRGIQNTLDINKILEILIKRYNFNIQFYNPVNIILITLKHCDILIYDNNRYFNNLKRYLKYSENLYYYIKFYKNDIYSKFNLYIEQMTKDYFPTIIDFEHFCVFIQLNNKVIKNKIKQLKCIIYILFLIDILDFNYVKFMFSANYGLYYCNLYYYNDKEYLQKFALGLINRYSKNRHSWFIAVYRSIINRYRFKPFK